MISCAKENLNLEVMGRRPWDRDDPVNQGVWADELVATSMHVAVRRVTYLDPVSGTRFEFLTTELTLAPGLIAHLYRLGWTIEKGFDEFKNKLGARKAWASGAIAKTIQARFLCLVHNLLLWFAEVVLEPARVTNQAEARRWARRLETTKRELARRHQTLPRLVESLPQGTQRSVKFIRWLSAATSSRRLPAARPWPLCGPPTQSYEAKNLTPFVTLLSLYRRSPRPSRTSRPRTSGLTARA